MSITRALATAMVAVVLAVGCDGTNVGGNPDTSSDGATPSDMAGHSPADLTPPAAKADLAPPCEAMQIPPADCCSGATTCEPVFYKYGSFRTKLASLPDSQSPVGCYVFFEDEPEHVIFTFKSEFAKMQGNFEGMTIFEKPFGCIRR